MAAGPAPYTQQSQPNNAMAIASLATGGHHGRSAHRFESEAEQREFERRARETQQVLARRAHENRRQLPPPAPSRQPPTVAPRDQPPSILAS